ncbi:MAG TPA: fibronectin type III domain-containing protein [Flavobacteriales bacterium]|nr:fibronectin type III domain-containing protein [Flavobacteriales bacterium]
MNATGMVERARSHEQRLDGNAAFPTPVPSLATITTAREALEAAITDALDGSRTAIAIRKARRTELKQLLDQLAGYVSSVAEGNELAILSSGFEVRRRNTPLPEPGAPKGLRAALSAHPGRAVLDWEPARGAVTYHVQVNRSSPDDAAAWELVGVSTRSRYTVNGLADAKPHWFRVSAIGAAGMSPWSDPALTMVHGSR